eukprot:2194851-Rhodomonas_salina.6
MEDGGWRMEDGGRRKEDGGGRWEVKEGGGGRRRARSGQRMGSEGCEKLLSARHKLSRTRAEQYGSTRCLLPLCKPHPRSLPSSSTHTLDSSNQTRAGSTHREASWTDLGANTCTSGTNAGCFRTWKLTSLPLFPKNMRSVDTSIKGQL